MPRNGTYGKEERVLSEELFRTLLMEYVGAEFSPEDTERLRGLVQRQSDRMHELQALDLGGEDPRTTSYIEDFRLPRHA